MADIFLSYARADADRAERIADALTAKGWSMWWDVSLVAHIQITSRLTATLETGLRPGEILGIQWQRVHEAFSVIDLPGSVTKTGIPRSVVISPRLAAVLEMLRRAQHTARELRGRRRAAG